MHGTKQLFSYQNFYCLVSMIKFVLKTIDLKLLYLYCTLLPSDPIPMCESGRICNDKRTVPHIRLEIPPQRKSFQNWPVTTTDRLLVMGPHTRVEVWLNPAAQLDSVTLVVVNRVLKQVKRGKFIFPKTQVTLKQWNTKMDIFILAHSCPFLWCGLLPTELVKFYHILSSSFGVIFCFLPN